MDPLQDVRVGQSRALRSSVAQGVTWTVLDRWGRRVLGVVVFTALVRLVPPRDFGLVALAGAFAAFVGIIIDSGLSRAVVQRRDLEEDHLHTVFWFSLIVGTSLTLLGQLAAAPLAELFETPRLAGVVRWISLAFLVAGASTVPEALLLRRLRFRALAIRGLVGTVAAGSLAIVMAAAGAGAYALVAQTVGNSAFGLVVLWVGAGWRPRMRFSRRHLADLFAFSAGVAGVDLLSAVNQRSDDFLVGKFLGPVQLGYYAVAYRLLKLLRELFLQPTMTVVLPAFSRVQDDAARRTRGALLAIRLTALVGVPAALLSSVLAPELIRAVFGPRWSPSIDAFRILSLVVLTDIVYSLNAQLLLSVGRSRLTLGVRSAHTAANVIAFVFAARHGITAVAAVFLLRGVLFLPVDVVLISRSLGVARRDYLRQFLSPTLAGVAASVCVLLVKSLVSFLPDLAVLGSGAVIGGVTYIVAVRGIDRPLFREAAHYVRLVAGRRQQAVAVPVSAP